MKPASGLPPLAQRAVFASIIQRYWLTALIVAIIIGAMGIFAWETGWGRYFFPDIPKFDGAPRRADNIAILPPFIMPPIDPTYKETVERPLFSQTRRPNPPATAAPIVPAMEKGKYRLSGTSVGPELSTAFLVDLRSGKTWRVVKGGLVDPTGSQGVKLDSVATTQVVLKLGEETEVLTLATSKSAAAPPPIPGLSPGAPQNMVPGAAPVLGGAPVQVAPNVSAGPAAANNFGAGGAFARPQNNLPAPVPGQTGNVPLPAVAGANSGPVPIQNDVGGIPVPGSANNTTTTNLPEPTAARRRRFQNLPQ